VISVDDSLLYVNQTGKPVFAQLSDDGTAIWVAVVEKAFAKVLGNYGKTDYSLSPSSLNILTGTPVFYYGLDSCINLATVF
jgi:hypothetical protein